MTESRKTVIIEAQKQEKLAVEKAIELTEKTEREKCEKSATKIYKETAETLQLEV
jgi:hypothetical protein